MATVKVQQKLGQAAFNVLNEQIKGAGVHVITLADARVVTADDVIGKVHNAFNLGGKIEVTVAAPPLRKGESYRFVKIDNVYYLALQ